jgi:hypothetical protein
MATEKTSQSNKNTKKNTTVIPPKKRGRKPKNAQQGEESDVTAPILEENENIILHLPIRPEELGATESKTTVMSTSIRIDDDISLSDVDEDSETELSEEKHGQGCLKCHNCHKKEKKIKELKSTIETLNESLKTSNAINNKSRKVVKVKIDLIDIVDGENKWKEKTDISCWWCSYDFNTVPCAIPEKFYKGKFYVFGCFCSYNCCVAYNLDLNDYKMWERYSLIKLLYYKITGENVNIMPAPPRQGLRKFGGVLEIKQFRNNCQTLDKEYRFMMPPMVSIVPLIEEDYRDKNTVPGKNAKSININSIAVAKATENLRIKRTKPLINAKFSLEESMGIKHKPNAQ